MLSEHLDVALQKYFSVSFSVLADVDHQVPHIDKNEQARDPKQGQARHLIDF